MKVTISEIGMIKNALVKAGLFELAAKWRDLEKSLEPQPKVKATKIKSKVQPVNVHLALTLPEGWVSNTELDEKRIAQKIKEKK